MSLRREEVLATLGAVSDFSFSWGLMDAYTQALQNQVGFVCLQIVGGTSTNLPESDVEMLA